MSSYDPGHDPACRILVPSSFAHTDEALAYWLSNPLLPAGRVEATRARLPMLSRTDKQALLGRLKVAIEKLRNSQPFRAGTYKLLIRLVRHELVSRKEQAELAAHLNRLRGAEVEWEYTRLENAIAARVAAVHERGPQVHSQEADDDEVFRQQEYEECDRDAA